MKKVIYTAIIDQYDGLQPPTEKTPGWDYVCFTDNPRLKSQDWQIIYVGNDPHLQHLDPVRQSRRIKILCHQYVNAYDLSIWHDASMHVRCDLDEFVKTHLQQSADMSLMSHPKRTCLYDEAQVCIHGGKDKRIIIDEQMARYRREGYPEHSGLAYCGLLLRKNNARVQALMQLWWAEVKNQSRRDQLSFNYALWKYRQQPRPLQIFMSPYNRSVFRNAFLRIIHLKDLDFKENT